MAEYVARFNDNMNMICFINIAKSYIYEWISTIIVFSMERWPVTSILDHMDQ